MDQQQANQMVNLLVSIEKKLATIANQLKDNDTKKATKSK